MENNEVKNENVEIVLEEMDFNESMELQKALENTKIQLDKIAGHIFRLTKEQEVYFNHERNLMVELDNKRKELIKRYKINEKQEWKVDPNTRKVKYI